MVAAVSASVAILAVYALAPWVSLAWKANVARGVERRMILAVLASVLIAHAALLAAAPVVAAWGVARFRKDRKAGRRSARGVRMAALGLATLLGLALAEGASAAWWAIAHRLPRLPSTFEADGPGRPARILVVGESSALGEPYQDWLSIGKIVAWQVEKAVPGREVEVDFAARGGVSLEAIYPQVANVQKRPDVVLVVSGHNEFQAHFAWDRSVPYYRDEPRENWGNLFLRAASRVSPTARMVREAIEAQALDLAPAPKVSRGAVDVPCCTVEEAEDRLSQFRRRLEAIADWSRSVGAATIFVVPASNDGGFEPNRSVLPPSATKAQRQSLAAEMARLREAESADPVLATASYRAVIARDPGFAEAQFRLARLLEASGAIGEARDRYLLARDLDAMPQRCRSAFQDTIRRVGSSRGTLVVDGPRVLAALVPDGLLDDRLFHDAHHPTLAGYTALASEALGLIRSRRLLGWPESVPAPRLDPSEVAHHFHFGPAGWAEVCRRSGTWYENEAYLRFDPSERLAKSKRSLRASELIKSGAAPEATGVPGVGPGW